MHHVYIDSTNDNRVFYIGMGLQPRVNRRFGRNKKHTNIGKKHGLNRIVNSIFELREDAIKREIELIEQFHTFIDDPKSDSLACNYTKGGEGCACSEEIRNKISNSRKGQSPWNKGKHVKYNLTDEERERRRRQRIAFNKTLPNLGRSHSNETRAKMRKSHCCSRCGKQGHQIRTCKLPKLL